MIKNAASMPIRKILGRSDDNKEFYYKIPPYQREYSWKKEHWESLFDDIYENDNGYFLGSIICIEEGTKETDLIDGQQKLTTISILLNSILQFIVKYHECNPDEKILDYVENEDNVLLIGTLKKLLYNESSKLVLSIQNSNNEDYKFILQENTFLSNISKPSNFGNRRISKAYIVSPEKPDSHLPYLQKSKH